MNTMILQVYIPYRKLQALGLTFIFGKHFCVRNSFACWRPRVVETCQVIVSGCPELLLELKRKTSWRFQKRRHCRVPKPEIHASFKLHYVLKFNCKLIQSESLSFDKISFNLITKIGFFVAIKGMVGKTKVPWLGTKHQAKVSLVYMVLCYLLVVTSRGFT
jgi:hypothetical protein